MTKVSMDDYQDVIAYLFRPHAFFTFPEVFLDFMSRHDAVTMSYLIGHSRRSGKERGWYYCKMKTMMTELRVSKSRQTQDIKNLVDLNLIQTKTVKQIRYIKINWDYIVPLIKKHMKDNQWIESSAD